MGPVVERYIWGESSQARCVVHQQGPSPLTILSTGQLGQLHTGVWQDVVNVTKPRGQIIRRDVDVHVAISREANEYHVERHWHVHGVHWGEAQVGGEAAGIEERLRGWCLPEGDDNDHSK